MMPERENHPILKEIKCENENEWYEVDVGVPFVYYLLCSIDFDEWVSEINAVIRGTIFHRVCGRK